MEEVRQLLVRADDAHAASAAAGRGFEDDRDSRSGGNVLRFFRGGEDAVRAGKDRHPAFFIAWRAFSFSPIRRDDFRGRADELDVGGAADFGEVGVLAEEAVAGMDGVDVGDFSGGDDGGDVEIAVGGRGGPMQMASSAKRTWSELRSASL